MATTDPIFKNNAGGMSSANTFGFKPQPINDDNSMANYVQSNENLLTAHGLNTTAGGQGAYGQGLHAMAPVFQYLTALTKGDQGDVSQAIQPEANRIQDSFAAIRNMISSQPRGGGKTSALAEAPFQQAKQIGDVAAGTRAGAAGQLGTMANTLAGLGLSESGLGLNEQSLALQTALGQRGQNVEERAATQQMIAQLASSAGKAAVGFYTG